MEPLKHAAGVAEPALDDGAAGLAGGFGGGYSFAVFSSFSDNKEVPLANHSAQSPASV